MSNAWHSINVYRTVVQVIADLRDPMESADQSLADILSPLAGLGIDVAAAAGNDVELEDHAPFTESIGIKRLTMAIEFVQHEIVRW